MSSKHNTLEKYGVLSTTKSGATLELRKVSWYNREAKLDIRSWEGEELARSSSKLTMTDEEAYNLYLLLDKYFNPDGQEQTNIAPTEQELIPSPPKMQGFGSLDSLSELPDLEDLDLVISSEKTIWDD